jgi:pilus assembly protein CpaF
MSLRERLVIADRTEEAGAVGAAAKDAIKRDTHALLVEELGPELDNMSVDDASLATRLRAKLGELLDRETTPMSHADRQEIVQDVIDDVMGYGPIQKLLDDATVTEIMVNNANEIFVEREGRIYSTDRRFLDEAHLMRIIDKIVGQVGRRVDESSPMVDARLPDGSRVNAIIAPLAINGPMLTIRKFSVEPYTAEDLIGFGTIDARLATFLDAAVQGRLNLLISGGTGTGKTTLLNVVSQYVGDDERVVTIEDSAELRLHQRHVLRLESRPANIEGKGEVAIRDLVRNSLRMRPDRIIVGEVRGGEALDMLQAMNTGHEGSLSTIHANSPRDALSRLETMVLMAGFDLPVRAIREQSSAALDVIIQLARLRDGSRRVVKVSEVEGLEGDTVVLQDIFYFDYSLGVDEAGRSKGVLKSTGLRPKFARKLEDLGIQLAPEVFEFEPPARR